MTSPAKTKEATFYNFKKCTNIDSTHTLVKNKCQSYSQCHGQGSWIRMAELCPG